MKNAYQPKNIFSSALKKIRKSKGLNQEDFSLISSRTYVSALERNMKSPTLNKVDDLAGVLGVHPLSLLVVSYLPTLNADTVSRVLEIVSNELSELK